MRFTKPAWVQHQNDDKRRTTICSVHVHPDGSRVATGGLDTKVRIWATKPILKPEAEESGRPPKLLSTLGSHVGPVMTVRWSNSGKWLASGSDDSLVMIWDLDPNGGGKVWGSDDVNVEGWKALKRLPGHESDVSDLAWSPKDRYLASVGLDNLVFIWCGYTLERLYRIEGHQGFVKGVCWDPVGQYLATQSDDRTVKIWRTGDWKEVKTISKPFVDSPSSTWFRRLSWSPDGAHITASNAMNAGAVFIATVIARETWQSDISLVGHENTVEAACYNPHIFLREPDKSVQTNNICSVVALGAGDGSVSVWQTKNPRPLVVGKECFTHPVLDLSWSPDGMTLYAVSFDGTMAVFDFDPEELEGIAPSSAQHTYLQKFDFAMPEAPQGALQYAAPVAAPQVVNQLVARKGGKNRNRVSLQQQQPNGVPSALTPNGTGPPQPQMPVTPTPVVPASHDPFSSAPLLMPGAMAPDMRYPSPSPLSRSFNADDLPPPIEALDDRERKRRRRDSDIGGAAVGSAFGGAPAPAGARARTLGGDRPRANIPARDLSVPAPPSRPRTPSGMRHDIRLSLPPLRNILQHAVEGLGELEALNSNDPTKPSEVALFTGSGRTVQWMDFLPSPALCLALAHDFGAVAMWDGSVNVYSHSGRKLMPSMLLVAPCAFMSSKGSWLLALTSTGQIYLWNVVSQASAFTPHSILPFLSEDVCVVDALVRDNGVAVLSLSSGVQIAFDRALQTWSKVAEPWWASGSDVVERSRAAARGPVSELERVVSNSNVMMKVDGTAMAANKWWGPAMTLGHLETRIHAARILESAGEWRAAVLVYAKRIADEGFRAKAEEMAHELCGPIYWKPGNAASKDWEPTVLGFEKREVLREVLGIFSKSKTLAKMAVEWQDLLKRMSAQ
ncbi:WD40 repeat-like protein [Auricularia subglabra TFB-10046 SS5]|nr:WD40 repeat-like protein [Auricularia subglabra TFB-10046 SS5]